MALLPFMHPFTCIVSGPTGCGKSSFVLRLTDNVDTMIKPTPDKIIYYFTEYQSIFDRYPHIDFRQGVPKLDEIDDMRNALIILDDMMLEADQRILNIFTRGSHHREISIIFMVQNFFNNNKHMRTISLNAQYIVLFKNPRDSSQFAHLARQLYPHNYRYAMDAYINSTKDAFSYLVVDLRNEQDEDLRLRTHIFPGEVQHVYVPK